jgi:ParB family chromosome partitioning protein
MKGKKMPRIVEASGLAKRPRKRNEPPKKWTPVCASCGCAIEGRPHAVNIASTYRGVELASAPCYACEVCPTVHTRIAKALGVDVGDVHLTTTEQPVRGTVNLVQKRPTLESAADAAGVSVATMKAGKSPKKVLAHVAQNTGNNEWYTPPAILAAARKVLGTIDLDPASSEIANKEVGATTFYTEQINGLEQDWEGCVWMNPPYAQPLIAQFCEKLSSSTDCGVVAHAICLTNNGTETKWGQRLFKSASAVCFPAGRLRFIDPQGKQGNAPLQGQMIVYFGNSRDRFATEFRHIGAVMLMEGPNV